MEGLPTVMSVVDSGGGVGGQDNLAFAVSEENGLNYGYIIHLPVDMAMQQELLGNVLTGGDHQNHLFVHQEHETKHSTQQSTIYLPVVTTSTSTTAVTSNNNCGDTNDTNDTEITAQSNHHHHPPIEFQYHLEEIPAFIDGQVQVEMSAEVDVKFDTLNFTSVQLSQEPPPSEQVNFNEDLNEVGDILSDHLTTSIITPPVQQPNSQVKANNSPSVSPKPTTTNAARTYGKPKPVKLISEDNPSQKNSQDIKLLSSPSPSSSSILPKLKVTKVHEVSVVKSQRVSAPIAIRKRRLIIDAQRQIPIPEFKRQLLNTKDIVNVRSDLAPGTKQAMKCLELGGVVQFFSSPGRAIRNVNLSRLFTNHLVMISSSVGHHCSSTTANSSFSVVPLSADLRVPSVLKSEDEKVTRSNFSKGHNCQFSNVPSTAYKRLINLSRPLECLFKGLRKPPVFKEYKKIQRKFPEKMNGGGGNLKMFHSRHKNKVKDKLVEDNPEDSNKVEGNVEEVVYTVVEEEGESVVLKSCHQEDGDGDGDVDSSDPFGEHAHHNDNDPLLLELQQEDNEEEGIKKESEVDGSNNVFSDDCTATEPTTFSMVNGENDEGEAGEDDLNKLLWGGEQVTSSSS